MAATTKAEGPKALRGRFPNQTKLFQAHFIFAQKHPELFPDGPARAPEGPLLILEALKTAAEEKQSDAYSFLLQAYLQLLGASPPKGVFFTPLEVQPKGRGRPSIGSRRYVVLAADLLGVKTVKLAAAFFPDLSPTEGRKQVLSHIKAAKTDLNRKLSLLPSQSTPEQRADAKTRILLAELRGWQGPSISKLART